MGDTAGKGADSFHFLRMNQLAFQMFFFFFSFYACGDIPGHI